MLVAGVVVLKFGGPRMSSYSRCLLPRDALDTYRVRYTVFYWPRAARAAAREAARAQQVTQVAAELSEQ